MRQPDDHDTAEEIEYFSNNPNLMTKPIDPEINIREIKLPEGFSSALREALEDIIKSNGESASEPPCHRDIRAHCVIEALREDLVSERAISEGRVKRLIEARIELHETQQKLHDAEINKDDHDHLGSDFDEFFGRIMHEHNLSATADVRDGIVWLSKAVKTANVRRNAVLGFIQQILDAPDPKPGDEDVISFDQALLTIGGALNGDLQTLRNLAQRLLEKQKTQQDIAPPASPDDVPPADESPL